MVEKEVKKTRGTTHPENFEARAPDGYHRDYILLLCDGLARKSSLFFFFFPSSSFSDSRIVSRLSFACKWQNRFQDSEPIITCFSSNKCGISDIRIPCSSSELHPTPCMRDVCRVRGLRSSCISKQNVLSLILLIQIGKLTNQKRGICRHCILYPLQLRSLFPDEA